ncbi:NAD(P)-binding protein [Trichoderma citrinoviride]|uniref:NAD(P)-binding protein n=1 Tax=Trichoderma citrinoviride TaxID=58853 RepID=A0A2T4BL38_9HYPO|nr:NAD(P)-binding protein [Trichoderma citrinoviride]PTB70034.1 NAD(P)-binding protein [Trichoderma citrinoviride]
MHIFISGATGRNGRIVLDNALSRGHSVTVLARNPSSSSLPSHPNLTIIQGTPFSEKDVLKALTTPRPPTAIITTLNQRRTSESPFAPLSPDSPPDLLASTTKTLLAALTTLLHQQGQAFPAAAAAALPKIVVNSLFGARESWASMIWPLRAVMSHSTMKLAIKDHNAMDRLIRESELGLTYVFARPARLTEGPPAGEEEVKVKVWPDDGKGCGWNAAVSRQSLGAWMVSAAETDEWDGRAPVLTN